MTGTESTHSPDTDRLNRRRQRAAMRSGARHADWTDFEIVRQAHWLAMAKDPEVRPLALRVKFAAHARHRRNGHAEFRRGELRQLLVSVDTKTGELRPANSAVLSRAIQFAIRKTWISPLSDVRCLVVLPEFVSGGAFGGENDRCRTHDSLITTVNDRPARCPSQSTQLTATVNERRVSAGHEPAPLTSSHSPHPADRRCTRCKGPLHACDCPTDQHQEITA